MNEKGLILYRKEYPDRCEGQLKDKDLDKFLTNIIERPNLNDQPDVSCIPYTQTEQQADNYLFEFHDTAHLPDCWGAANMQDGRTGICFHSANFVRQLEGCCATGFGFGYIEDENGLEEYGIMHSKQALEFLKEYIGRDADGKLLPFRLTICKVT